MCMYNPRVNEGFQGYIVIPGFAGVSLLTDHNKHKKKFKIHFLKA